MRTFALHNGDIALGSGGYELISGAAKLQQDLGVALSEPFNCDRFHPQWGSVLINYVGNPIGVTTKMLVQAEISRVLQNYMKIQNSFMVGDASTGRKARYGPGEVIQNITGIDIRQEYDRYFVKVSLTTLSGDQVNLFQTVQG